MCVLVLCVIMNAFLIFINEVVNRIIMIVTVAFTKAFYRHWHDQHLPPLYQPSSTIVLSTITKPGRFGPYLCIQNIDTAAQAFKHTFTSHISSANSLQVGSVLTVTRSSSERVTWECGRGITDAQISRHWVRYLDAVYSSLQQRRPFELSP